jgi:hypothetical protein
MTADDLFPFTSTGKLLIGKRDWRFTSLSLKPLGVTGGLTYLKTLAALQ